MHAMRSESHRRALRQSERWGQRKLAIHIVCLCIQGILVNSFDAVCLHYICIIVTRGAYQED